MTSALPKPATITQWVRLLDAVRLPVPKASHERVCMALSNHRRSLREVAELMQSSPTLALSVIREANQQASANMSEPAENLESALSRLGIKRTTELLAQLPALATQNIPPALLQLQMISQHATQQANGLFANRLARLWQDIHWGSLLFLAPLWPLALTHPQLLEEWALRVLFKQEAAVTVEHELFGVRLLELCLALGELWRLPEWVLHGYRLLLNDRHTLARALRIARNPGLSQQQDLDADPTLRRLLNQPANTVIMANCLALSAQQAWNSPQHVRWQQLIGLYIQQPLDEVQQQIHQQAAHSARNHASSSVQHPAEALIWPWETRRVERKPVPTPPPSAQSLRVWREHCAELLQEPSVFTNAMHLTTCARDAMVACGMHRVMLLMTDRNLTRLRVHQTAGLANSAAALNLLVSQSVALQRLLARPAQIRLTPANNTQFSAWLPSSLRSLFDGEHLLLRSLSSNGRVVMLVVADQGGRPFSEISVQAFGKTAQCVEKALYSFTNRGN